MVLNLDCYQRVIVITGSFGSGKSEYAINLALQEQASEPRPIAFVDLDLVNAYFRTWEIHIAKRSCPVRLACIW